MSDTQFLTIALAAVPNMLTVLVGILINNARLTDLRVHADSRFDEMRDLWRAELHRVEEVLDARLKHLEDQRLAAILSAYDARDAPVCCAVNRGGPRDLLCLDISRHGRTVGAG